MLKTGGSRRRGVQLTVGTMLIVTGSSFAIFWPDIFEYLVYKEFVLENNSSETFAPWKSMPLDSLDIYFFNWTNHEEFKNKSSKPHLTQLGPYRFHVTPDKDNIQFHPHNSTVSYRKLNHYWFDAEGSNGTLEDVMVSPNVVALSATNRLRKWSILQKVGLNLVLKGFDQKYHIVKKVNEMMFEGYDDSMIDFVQHIPMVDVPFNRFGWFYTRNGSSATSGLFNIKTGADNIEQFGEIQNWNNQKQLKYFPGECGKLRGSGGEIFTPKQKRDKPVDMFNAESCRVISFDYEKDVVLEGVTGYKYIGGPRMFDNGSAYPENECFCQENCAPSGVTDISECQYGAPAFISFPHFLYADPTYLQGVDGLEPDEEKHQLSITLEPEYGIPLDVRFRFQVNLLVRPDDNYDIYKDVPKVYFPMFWYDLRWQIKNNMASDVHLLLNTPSYGRIVLCLIALTGFIIIVRVLLRGESLQVEDLESKGEVKPEGLLLIHIPGTLSKSSKLAEMTKLKLNHL